MINNIPKEVLFEGFNFKNAFSTLIRKIGVESIQSDISQAIKKSKNNPKETVGNIKRLYLRLKEDLSSILPDDVAIAVLASFVIAGVNTIIHIILIQAISKFSKSDAERIAKIVAASIVAPITEETAKYIAAKNKKGTQFGIIFALCETIINDISQTNYSAGIVAGKAAYRTTIHSTLQLIHTTFDEYGYPKTGFAIAAIIHGIHNFLITVIHDQLKGNL